MARKTRSTASPSRDPRRLEERCTRRLCTLKPLTDVLYLWTMASMTQLAMLSHFLEHYQQLGVRPAHMSFVLHRGQADDDAAVASGMLLARHGVRNVSVTSSYHTDIKRQLVNEYIQSLPSNAWLLYADVDELYHFPCEAVEHVMAMHRAPDTRDAGGHKLFSAICGFMVDRLPEKRELPSIDLERPLPEQFPVCSPVRKMLNRMLYTANSTTDHSPWNQRKYMLIRVLQEDKSKGSKRVQFKSSHTLMPGGPDCATSSERLMGSIDHYSFDAQAAALLQQKHAVYESFALSEGANHTLGATNENKTKKPPHAEKPSTRAGVGGVSRALNTPTTTSSKSENAAHQYEDLLDLLDWNASSPRLTESAWSFIIEGRVCCPSSAQLKDRASTATANSSATRQAGAKRKLAVGGTNGRPYPRQG